MGVVRGRERAGPKTREQVEEGEEDQGMLGKGATTEFGWAPGVREVRCNGLHFRRRHNDGADGADGNAVGPTHHVISKEQSAEMLFPAGKKNYEDYH